MKHLPAILMATFVALFAGIYGAIAITSAAPPPSADCSGVPATAYCVAVPMHGIDRNDPLFSTHNTRFYVFHEGSTNGNLTSYYMTISGTALLTDGIGLPIFKPGKYYGRSVDNPMLDGWRGTTVFSGTVPFSVQNLDPNDFNCPDNVWEGLCDFIIYTPRDTYSYSIMNSGSYPISQTHDIYRNGTLYTTVHHQVPPFTMARFTIPTPTATPPPEPTPVGATATPTPTQTTAQLRAAREAQASGIGFEVRVTNPTATPTPTPPVAATKRVYIPLVAR